MVLKDGLQALHQANSIGHLDRQAGSGIDLDHHWPSELINHQVDSQVAQACHLLTNHRHFHDAVPAGHLDTKHIEIRVRMVTQAAPVMHRSGGNAGYEINADAKRPLVQVGSSVGFDSGCPQHGHHRVARPRGCQARPDN